jgi:hypothetical protein
MHPTLAFWFVMTVAVLTSSLAYIFDWNKTHVFNPNWPLHAKFSQCSDIASRYHPVAMPNYNIVRLRTAKMISVQRVMGGEPFRGVGHQLLWEQIEVKE